MSEERPFWTRKLVKTLHGTILMDVKVSFAPVNTSSPLARSNMHGTLACY